MSINFLIVIVASTMNLLAASSWGQVSNELLSISRNQVLRIENLRYEMKQLDNFLKYRFPSKAVEWEQVLNIFEFTPIAAESVSIKLVLDRITGFEALRAQVSPWNLSEYMRDTPHWPAVRDILSQTSRDQFCLRNLAFSRRQFVQSDLDFDKAVVEQNEIIQWIVGSEDDSHHEPVIGRHALFVAQQKRLGELTRGSDHVVSARRRWLQWERLHAVWQLYQQPQTSIRWEEELQIETQFLWEMAGSLVSECMQKLRLPLQQIGEMNIANVSGRLSLFRTLLSHMPNLDGEFLRWAEALEVQLLDLQQLKRILDFPIV